MITMTMIAVYDDTNDYTLEKQMRYSLIVFKCALKCYDKKENHDEDDNNTRENIVKNDKRNRKFKE